jgi:hypothetical protein
MRRLPVVGRVRARTLTQHLFQARRPPVLLQKIAECLIGKLLDRRHTIAREPIKRVPSLRIELERWGYRIPSLEHRRGNHRSRRD